MSTTATEPSASATAPLLPPVAVAHEIVEGGEADAASPASAILPTLTGEFQPPVALAPPVTAAATATVAPLAVVANAQIATPTSSDVPAVPLLGAGLELTAIAIPAEGGSAVWPVAPRKVTTATKVVPTPATVLATASTPATILATSIAPADAPVAAVYHRKEKSLTTLMPELIARYGVDGVMIDMDEVLRESPNWKKRRLYDVMSVLLTLRVVERAGTSLFCWRGIAQVSDAVAEFLQRESVVRPILEGQAEAERGFSVTGLAFLTQQFVLLLRERALGGSPGGDPQTLRATAPPASATTSVPAVAVAVVVTNGTSDESVFPTTQWMPPPDLTADDQRLADAIGPDAIMAPGVATIDPTSLGIEQKGNEPLKDGNDAPQMTEAVEPPTNMTVAVEPQTDTAASAIAMVATNESSPAADLTEGRAAATELLAVTLPSPNGAPTVDASSISYEDATLQLCTRVHSVDYKTVLRRLYDIVNILTPVGLLGQGSVAPAAAGQAATTAQARRTVQWLGPPLAGIVVAVPEASLDGSEASTNTRFNDRGPASRSWGREKQRRPSAAAATVATTADAAASSSAEATGGEGVGQVAVVTAPAEKPSGKGRKRKKAAADAHVVTATAQIVHDDLPMAYAAPGPMAEAFSEALPYGGELISQPLAEVDGPRPPHVGHRVEVYWDGEKAWFEAEVLSYHPCSSMHSVRYAADGYECDEFLDVLCELGVPRWRYITGGAGVTTTASAAGTGAGPSTPSDLTGIGPARATEIDDTDADAEGASGLLSLLSRS